MFKHNLVHKLVLIALPFIGVSLLGGCSIYTAPGGERYVYHASNGRVFYQASDGRYYYEGKDGRFYYKKYYVKRNGHYYYRYYPDTNGVYVNNSNMSVHVRERLLNDPVLHGQLITVRTHGHWVELLGNVQTKYQKERAAALAMSVPGVRYVDDDLVVTGE